MSVHVLAQGHYGLFEARAELIRHATRRRAPHAVLTELEKIANKRYASMADVTKATSAAHAPTGAEREVPVPGFNELTVEQAAKRLRRLRPDKLRRVRAYELAHKKRKTVLAAIDRLLAGELR
jgi:uncharacterized protein DUF2795